MTDIEIAIFNLTGHSICLCRHGVFFTDDNKGIGPMMHFISEKRILAGYSVADIIIGKAAAMLFIKTGIVNIYGRVISRSGLELLQNNGINTTYEKITDRILNRVGSDICPIEKAIANIDNIDEGYTVLSEMYEKILNQSYKSND